MSEESLMPERDEIWAKHDGLTPALAAEMLAFAGKMEMERNVWKHDAKLLADELKSENEKAIDWFIHAHELKDALREALQWIDDGDDQKGRDLIVGPSAQSFLQKRLKTKTKTNPMNNETKSDTPQTDQMASTMFPDGSRWVQIEDCRKMERERDEARAMAHDMRSQFEKASTARLIFPWENAPISGGILSAASSVLTNENQ